LCRNKNIALAKNQGNNEMIIFVNQKIYTVMSLLNQNNKKGKKKDNKKASAANAQDSKFIQKPKSAGFVSKQSNTGSQRGS
jgi:hypothetical protein